MEKEHAVEMAKLERERDGAKTDYERAMKNGGVIRPGPPPPARRLCLFRDGSDLPAEGDVCGRIFCRQMVGGGNLGGVGRRTRRGIHDEVYGGRTTTG
jgi:hypothetical protein